MRFWTSMNRIVLLDIFRGINPLGPKWTYPTGTGAAKMQGDMVREKSKSFAQSWARPELVS